MSKPKAIIIGGSKGIGKAIADSLAEIKCQIVATSRKDIDTSDLASVKKFARLQKTTDILVLNTGGPPKKNFFDITEKEWLKYHNQLFVSFCLLLQNLKINPGGFIFLISSHLIKEPNETLALSFTYRLAFWSVLKSLTKHYSAQNISCINIAPGPIKTERLQNLTVNMAEFEKTLPLKRAGDPREIGDFVSSVVKHKIKYLNGTVINFDGGLSKNIF